MSKFNLKNRKLIFIVLLFAFIAVAIFSVDSNASEYDENLKLKSEIKQAYKDIDLKLSERAKWETLRKTLKKALNNPKIKDKKDSVNKNLPIVNKKSLYLDLKIGNEYILQNDISESLIMQNINLYEQLKHLESLNIDNEDIKQETFLLLGELEQKIKDKETDYKLCYLTFDDGPYARTDEFLKILKNKHVQATFFTTSINGKYCFDNPKKETAPFYRKYLAGGHTIANHTFTHGLRGNLYSSKDTFINAIKKQEKHVKELTGYKTNIMRFPGGSPTAGSLKNPIIKDLRKLGYAWVDWSASVGDGGKRRYQYQEMREFKRTLDSPIEVVLSHDYSDKTQAILPKMIKYARNHNYILAPLFHESKALNH